MRRPGHRPAESHQRPYPMGENMKIKVKKVERIEATRPHADPNPPQGAA
jgi:hypothetical protein